MSFKTRLAGLGLVTAAVLAPLTAMADPAESRALLATCIQSELGLNLVDGDPGRGTRAAVNTWLANNPAAPFPELTRDGTYDLELMRDLCFAIGFENVKTTYGTLFSLIVMQDGSGDLKTSEQGPAFVRQHTETGWMQVLAVSRGFGFQNNVTPGVATPAQSAFLDSLPESIEVLGSTDRIDSGFLTAFETGGEMQMFQDQSRTYAVREIGDGGPQFMIIFNGDEPVQLMITDTAAGWGEELPTAVAWDELKRTFPGLQRPSLADDDELALNN